MFPLEVQGRSNYLLHIPTHPRHGWASASVILTEDKGQRLFYLAFPPPPSESHGQLPGPAQMQELALGTQMPTAPDEKETV